MNPDDRNLLRDLARRYVDMCSDPAQNELRRLWRRLHNLKSERPLIYVRAFAWGELPESICTITDPFWRNHESFFRRMLYRGTLGDDSIFEPWITLHATHVCEGWGVDVKRHFSDEPGGSFKIDYALKDPGDLSKMRVPWHGIDEKKTSEDLARLQDVLGDVITINVDRSPAYRMWTGDISTDLGYLRGIENIMLDMMDNPDWLKALVKFMSDGIEKVQSEAEKAGDWSQSAHENQCMPYAEELPDPAANVNGVTRRKLWGYMASQEFTTVSPAMQDEFLLQYQKPIMAKFGLVAYGCCEDLSRKIDILRSIPNLRRIAVSPFADVASCAGQIGRDYVLSYRPSPTDMVGYGLDAERIRSILRRDLALCRNCHTDITLKDVETVQRDPSRVKRWVALAREVIDELY